MNKNRISPFFKTIVAGIGMGILVLTLSAHPPGPAPTASRPPISPTSLPPSSVRPMFSLFGLLCSLLGGWVLVVQYTHIPFRYRVLHPLIPRERFFVFCLFSLVAKLAKADGQVSEEEMRRFRQFVQTTLNLSHFQERQAGILFRQARDGSTSFHDVASLFVERFQDEPAVLFTMLELLLDIAAADPVVTAAELSLLDQFATLIHMAPHRFAAAMDEKFRGRRVEGRSQRTTSGQEQRKQQGSTPPPRSPLQDAYAKLGIQPNASWDEIKSSYRTLAKQYHPDRLRAQGVPANMLRRATDHFRELKDAYELIRSEKGQ